MSPFRREVVSFSGNRRSVSIPNPRHPGRKKGKMEDISEWKYPKLINRAKELGIVFDNPKVDWNGQDE